MSGNYHEKMLWTTLPETTLIGKFGNNEDIGIGVVSAINLTYDCANDSADQESQMTGLT
jgi:hypothetical protein